MTNTQRSATASRLGADAPDTDPEGAVHFVLGGGHVGTAVAERLRADGHLTVVVDETYRSADVPGVSGDPAAVDVLEEAGIAAATTAIVATRSDARNLLIAQLLRAHFDVPRVVVLANDPDRLPTLAAAGHEPFCVSTALSEALTEAL